MGVEFQVYADSPDDLEDLREWMTGQDHRITAAPVWKPAGPNTLGSVWDFLSVACAAGGAGTAALGVLAVWIRSKRISVRVKLRDYEFSVDGNDKVGTDQALSRILDTVQALEKADVPAVQKAAGDERS